MIKKPGKIDLAKFRAVDQTQREQANRGRYARILQGSPLGSGRESRGDTKAGAEMLG
jgi:hypothetical protein